jgi:transmembrane sensor
MRPEDQGNKQSPEDRISIEATGWIAKRDEGFTAEEQDAFFEWLAADPRHKQMYNRRLGLWHEMNLLTDWRPEHSAVPNPDLLAVNREHSKKNRLMAYSALAALLVFGVFGFQYLLRPDKEDTLMLAFGGAHDYESHVLVDGSVVELNQGAQVSVQYSKNERMIFLHTGEAHFKVEKDASRPFLVRAGDAVVRATGTAFNVSLQDHGVEVIVTEGRVLVNTSVAPEVEVDNIIEEADAQELVAGQRSLVVTDSSDSSTSQVELVTAEEIDRRLSWKGEVLDFENVPLAKVVGEFNKRNRTKILIADNELLTLKVTAKLRSSNLDLFIELLKITMAVDAQRDELSNIVLRKDPDFKLKDLPTKD